MKLNTLKTQTLLSDTRGYVVSEPTSRGTVRLVAISPDEKTTTAPFYVGVKNHAGIMATAERLLVCVGVK